MLNSVRIGERNETISALISKVIKVSLVDKYDQVSKLGTPPVATIKECDDFNKAMLSQLYSQIHKILCTYEVDDSSSTTKWSNKSINKLEKVNKNHK